ncbi:lipopolysaccharide assembly protein LapA domain-containing protein [Actinomycetospora endophytica]|uniref:Lipopolysaccharide assembly protein LapA domain-containing protein n=1 Tax=Actinomycetospora endophytica TaxID=2291215 RepID=A0ABS8PG25_9PSEU|nr:LapA family protein [Actinomycetospora endophytica]MCD2197178.1 lipopolysaccharide assembly protein LapA domain-containing protein [Actinomycetospora endophytica]
MSEQPDLTAPSPADGPTTPGSPAVPESTTTRPVERETDRLPGGTAGAGELSDPTSGAVDPTSGAAPTRTSTAPRSGPGVTRIGGAWVGLIVGAVLLIFLLIFVLQNLGPARVYFLGWQAELPLGIWLLFAAIAGVLLLAIPGLARMLQWRRASKGGRARR